LRCRSTPSAAAGLSYFNPHSFRKTLAQICKTPEEYKAWSQNLGHENVLTTFSSYGDVARHRQAEIIRALGKSEQHACISSSSLIALPAGSYIRWSYFMIRARL
jgi:integrase